ncbi:RNA-binding domain-containing protein [Pseudomonas sp. 18175]|uniref:RNA-binding domain-containing protein n=1 Tax=Pseudomonas sp. 18175 TaxID=3390056 RepID=UPI003D1CA46F
MATESEVSIGGTYLGGTARYLGDEQASLFNSSDLVATGDIKDDSFRRVYSISIAELRRRLEALGYSLPQVRNEIVSNLRNGYKELEADAPTQCKEFLDYGCSITIEQLIELAQQWKTSDKSEWNYLSQFNMDNFPETLLEFIQGCSSELLLPSQNIWLHGHYFERLLCEVHTDDELFEIDFTQLIRAGYYKPDAQPISDDFDHSLTRFHPRAFRLMDTLTEEESDTLEFKSVSAGNPSKAIAKQLPKYLIGFLNNKGGQVLFGVSDAGIAEGVSLNRNDRDLLYREIAAATLCITPNIAQTEVKVELRPLISAGTEVSDKFVVDISVPCGRPNEMYFTTSGETWYRFGTTTNSLTGHKLFNHICARYSSADNLLRAVTQRYHAATDEIRRMEQDEARSQADLAEKKDELSALRESVSSAWKLLKETDLICPSCDSPIARRHSFEETLSIGGKDIGADCEYIEYTCGYSTRDDRTEPLSPCSNKAQPQSE